MVHIVSPSLSLYTTTRVLGMLSVSIKNLKSTQARSSNSASHQDKKEKESSLFFPPQSSLTSSHSFPFPNSNLSQNYSILDHHLSLSLFIFHPFKNSWFIQFQIFIIIIRQSKDQWTRTAIRCLILPFFSSLVKSPSSKSWTFLATNHLMKSKALYFYWLFKYFSSCYCKLVSEIYKGSIW